MEKFEKLATHVLPRSQVEQLRDATLGLDKLQDAKQLAHFMARTSDAMAVNSNSQRTEHMVDAESRGGKPMTHGLGVCRI